MRKTILVADDMADERKLVRLLLRKYDVAVVEATNGGDAVKLAKKYKPSLILIDHMMPGMTGYDCIQELRQDLELRGIPIIMLTSRKFDAGFRDFMRYQIDDFLQKPVESKSLLESIQARIGALDPKVSGAAA